MFSLLPSSFNFFLSKYNTLSLWVVAAPVNLDFHITSYGCPIPSVPFAISLFVCKSSLIYPDWSETSASVGYLTVTEMENTDCLWTRLPPARGLRELYLVNVYRDLETGDSHVEKQEWLLKR